MSDSGLFLKKKKKPRPRPLPSTQHAPSPAASSNPLHAASSASASPHPLNGGSPVAASDPSKIVEFKLLSSGSDNAFRYNLMRLNSLRDVDPRAISRPILMNRKEPGPKAPPVFAQDDSGKIVGRYVYDNAGKPVMDASGQHVVEKRDEKDLTLIGVAAGGSRRTTRKGVKEVHHQDIEVIRLRREEQTPWILESAKPKSEKEQGAMAEHWVGRMMEPASMPTVLLVNDGTMGMGFKVMPLGRTYRFEPERPFKVADPETANKNYEQQSKNRFKGKWANREAGPSTGPVTGRSGVARSNAELWERNISARLMNQTDGPRVKREAFDDDSRREGRLMERGMEGGVDEELDYDFKEEFQDDEENNTFYQDPEEEEEAKAQEEQLKKEFKMANANVGDRPQISSDEEDEEDLFGDRLNQEGKRIRKMMKKRGGAESGYGTSESDDSDSETIASESKDKKDKEKEKEKEKGRSREPSAAPSDRPSRPASRGPGARVTSSPTGRPHQPPAPGKASTAPPGSGAALLAQRAATGGASPRHSRQTSPLGRAQSPEKSRGGSPTLVSREASPTPSASGSTRKAPPHPRPENPSKRKTPVHSLSPGPSPNNKRKPSPSPSVTGSGGDASRKKKKSGSNTPTPGPEFEPFPGMITREEVLDWFRRRQQGLIPMGVAIGAFKERIKAAGDRQLDNQKVFLGIVQSLTRSEPEKMLRIEHLNDNWTWLQGWIDAPLNDEAGRLARFKRTVEVDKATIAKPCLIRLSADTRYKLVINGERVCVGPTRGSDRFWFYDTVDFAPYLKVGSNLIEILVMRYFPSENVAESFGRTCRPGLTVHGSIGSEGISTGKLDTKWVGGEERNRVLSQATEFDHFLNTYEETAARDTVVKMNPLKRHKLWNKQGVLSPWFLEPRAIPFAEETPCPLKAVRHADSTVDAQQWENFISTSKPLTLERGSKHRIELEFEVHSTAFVSLSAVRPGSAGSKVRFTYSESYEVLPRIGQMRKSDRTKREGHGLTGPSDAYTFSGPASGGGATESYEPFWWKTFRFIVLDIEVADDPLTLESLVFTQTNYPMGIVADWRATSESEKMWEVSIRTMRNCMFDGYSDCPFYEQLQYGEDSRSAMLFHYLLSGDDRLGRQAITAFAGSIQPDGLLLARYPAHTKQVITGFNMFWIMEVCDHMLYFNDPAFAIQFLPIIDSIFAFYERQTDPKTGLISNLPRWFWSFIDWNKHWETSDQIKGFYDNGMPIEGRETGTWSYFTMLYAFTLRRVCTLLEQIDKTAHLEDYTARADRASKAVKRHCYDGQYFTDSTLEARDTEKNPLSQVAQIWGILSLAVDAKSDDARRILLEAFKPDTSFAVASYVMQHYSFRVLSAAGLYERFYDSMWTKWRLQLKKNMTTWEEDDVNNRSDCHEWSALQPYEYLTEVAGLRPLQPGWETVEFFPRWKLYESIDAKVALGHQGVAQVSWTKSKGKCQVKLKLPRVLKLVSRGGDGREVDHGAVDHLDLKFEDGDA